MSSWLEASRGMRWQVIVSVWASALIQALLGALWLQVPDSHVWQFVLSIVSACLLIALPFWSCCAIFKQVLNPQETARWWLKWVLLAAVFAVWWLLQMPIDRLVAHRELYAGYWTSQLPRWVRGLRTYEQVIQLQDCVYFTLRLIVTGLLLPVAVMVGASGLRGGLQRIVSVWTRWWYWVAVLVCGWLAFAMTDRLMDWTPAPGLTREILSLIARLGFAFTLNVLLVCFVLELIAVALRRRGSIC